MRVLRPLAVRLVLGVLGCGAASAAVLTVGHEASAKSAYDSDYGFERTWNASLRLVRVDRGYKITEKDEANGYILFEYKSADSKNVTSGSIELIRGANATDPVRVVVQLPQMPRYHEQVLIDDLARKLRHEYGEPPAKKKDKPAEKAPSDAGADAAP
jgi:hypothetical protein